MISNLEKKIFSNTFYQVFGKLITSFLGFVISVFVARQFGILDFGQYTLIFTFLGLATIFGDFGLGTLLIREVAAKRADENYIAAVFTLRLVLIILLTTISLIVLPFFPYSSLVKSGIILALIGNIFLGLSSIYWAVFQAQLKFLSVVLIQISASALTAFLVFVGFIKTMPLLYFVFATALGNLTIFALSVIFAKKIKLTLSMNLMKKILTDVWPIGLWAIVSTFYFKIDFLLISFFFNPSKNPDLGLYAAAYKYFEVVGVFVGFFQLTTYPIIAGQFKKRKFLKVFKKIVYYSLILGISSSILLFFASQPLILILGQNFLPAVKSLQILCLSLAFSVFSGPWVSLGVASGKQKVILYFSILALILNISGNLLIIPKYSFYGASWITVLTQLFITGSSIYVGKKVINEAN